MVSLNQINNLLHHPKVAQTKGSDTKKAGVVIIQLYENGVESFKHFVCVSTNKVITNLLHIFSNVGIIGVFFNEVKHQFLIICRALRIVSIHSEVPCHAENNCERDSHTKDNLEGHV